MPRRGATVALGLLIFAFVVGFYALSVRQLQAQIPEQADLGQMMLALWNTAHGRFVQEVKADAVSTRLTDHVEPIFIPVSVVLRLWADVRALLLVQVVALALGAIPVFALARAQLHEAGVGPRGAAGAALAFAAAYLLFPALQAPTVADFHAIPLAAAPIAFALWFAHRRNGRGFLVAVFVLLAVKEEAALLAFLLGAYAALRCGMRRAGLVACAASLVWFAVATFAIIPHYASTVYDASASVYFRRYGELGDSPADIVVSLLTRPGRVLAILSEAPRVAYLLGLLLPVGFLALLAPEILLLSAPLLAANVLSSYPLQYSGELHYSAPLVPYFVMAAAVGVARLLRRVPLPRRPRALALATVWLLVWSVGYQRADGFTPLGREFTWPAVTAHHRLLARFTAQIPAGAPGSVTTGLYPHLAARETLYTFPALADAEWVLLDVTGATDMHPADLHRQVSDLLAAGDFGVRDAADGYILLARGETARTLPDAFYGFARAAAPRPQHPVRLRFGDRLLFLGYDVLDDGKWGLTAVRTYWQLTEPWPSPLRVWPFFVGADGASLADPAALPPVASLWYPPRQWAVGETVAVETVPWYLPERWALAVGVLAGEAWANPPERWPVQCLDLCDGVALFDGDTWARLATYERQGRRLVPFTVTAPAAPTHRLDAAFTGGIALVGYDLTPAQAAAGDPLALTLYWQATTPPAADYQVFVHLRDEMGATIVWADGAPQWFGPRPATGWPPGETIGTAHTIPLPAGLPAGRYAVAVGLYDWQTGARLPLADGAGDEVQWAATDLVRR